MTTDTDEREAFEIAAKADGLDVGSWDDDDQMYDDASTQWAWQGWQARASVPAGAPEVRALEVEPSAVEMARKDGVAATQTLREAMRQRRERDPSLAKHPDDIAVDSFAQAMREKLARKRALGYGGWDDKDRCSAQHLSDLLRSHVEKGDPIDVANFAMMLHQRSERIVPEPAPAPVEGEPRGCPTCSGRGLIGVQVRFGDGEVDAIEEPCPDCSPTAEPIPSDAFERGARAMRNEIADTYCKGGNSYVGDEIRAWPLPKEET